MGKLKGATTAAGPLARNRTIAGCGPSATRRWGRHSSASAKAKSNFAITAATSRRASRRGLPTSATISRARSSRLAFSRSRHRARAAFLASRLSCRQPRNARFEISTALRTSPAEISAISTDRSPGLRTRQTFGSALMEYFASLRVARCVERLLGEQFFQFANPALEEVEGGLNGRRRTHVHARLGQRLDWEPASSALQEID